MTKTYLTNSDVMMLAARMAERIEKYFFKVNITNYTVYAIPRGGIPAAYALQRYMTVEITEKPEKADFFVDDIIDSGKTAVEYQIKYSKPLFSLVNKVSGEAYWFNSKNWIVFPWEKEEEDNDKSVTNNITRLLQYIGESPEREGLKDTPERVIKAWEYWTNGYTKNAADILKSFEDGAASYDEMIVVKDIPFYSKCEHHLVDIFGTATVAYIPNGQIVGLSKINRLVDMFARRLQVQERLTNQIAEAFDEHLHPVGVGVIVKARHMCMESRGICQQGHLTITSALRGAIKNSQQARSEFLKLAE